jgi:membrane protein
MMHHWQRLESLLFEPPPAGRSRLVALALTALRYLYALLRDLAVGDINLRAMSLVYSTLLAIVPLIALGFSVIHGLGIDRNFQPLLFEFFRPLGDRAGDLTERVLGFVEHLQGGVLGSLGLAFLVWTVLSAIQKVEEAFNHIWHVERVRSLARRFSGYLSVLIVGPALMGAAFGLVASFAARTLVAWLEAHEPFGAVLVMIGKLAPLLLVATGFTFLYSFVPNTRVQLRVALIAGLAAGAAWVAANVGFAELVAYSSRMMAIYAGFAIVLLALMWIWLNWLILLFGALFAFYLQHPQYLRSGQREVVPTARLRERLALSAMFLVGQAFTAGDRRWTVATLAETLAVPSIALGPIVDALESAGLLETTEDETLLPGRDPSRIMLDAILAAVRDGGSGRAMTLRRAQLVPAAERACDRIDDTIRAQLGRVSLHEFVGGSPSRESAAEAPV